jgi:hypothetical protein
LGAGSLAGGFVGCGFPALFLTGGECQMVTECRALIVVMAALTLFHLAGCGESGPKTHSVKGRVVFDGDVKQLAGGHVEFQQQSEAKVLAYGEIKDDGAFELRTLHEGKSLSGALEGTYRVRIVLGGKEEDDDEVRRKKSPIHARFLEFDKSGPTFNFPSEGEVIVKVSRK